MFQSPHFTDGNQESTGRNLINSDVFDENCNLDERLYNFTLIEIAMKQERNVSKEELHKFYSTVLGNIYTYTRKLEHEINQHKSTASGFEFKVAKILDSLEVIYETQKTFPECKHKTVLPFDFYFQYKNVDYLIECDGRQHFEPIDYFGGVPAFEKLKIRDEIKNNFCLNNDKVLIRIPYTMRKFSGAIESAILNSLLD